MVWAVFIGASMGAKSGAHIGVEAFVKLFPRGWTKPLIVVSAAFSVLFCAVVFYLSTKVVINIFNSGQVSPAMEMPMYWAYAAVPVGVMLMGIRFVEAAVIALGKMDREGNQ
jgi:C4-dicarboxylate transporter DctQ subunit